MTTNQTIDGVQRERIERALCAVEQVGLQDKFIDYAFIRAVKYELIALLDADIPASVAEQPAPVAVVLPERLPGDDGVCTESHYASGWNACLDEVTRLNPSL